MNQSEVQNCPVRRGLLIFEGKWNSRVLYELILNGTMRFGQLKKAIPEISNTVLTSTLKDLESKRLIERIQFNEIPPHVEYSLSESGRAVIPIFDAIGAWGEKYGA